MDKLKKEKLEKKGWKVGDVDEYLGLSPAEKELIAKNSTQIPSKIPENPK
jgi:hypothetical protein